MTTIYWNKKTNKVYGWKASKYCIPMNTENKRDCREMIAAGVMKEAGD